MSLMRTLKRWVPVAFVVSLLFGALPMVSTLGRDAKSVASDTLNQTIGGLSEARSYLQGANSSGQMTSTINVAISDLQAALDSLSSGGNITAAQLALQQASNAFALAENETGSLGNETANEQANFISEAITRAESRAFEISNYTQLLKNATLGAQLFANITVATGMLSSASLQVQSGNLTGAQSYLQSALSILDRVNIALGNEEDSEDFGQNQPDYQGKLGAAINQTLGEIGEIRGQLNSSSITQSRHAQATSLLDNATSFLNEAASKLSGGDTQAAWSLFNQAKLAVDQAQNLIEGESEGDD